METRGTPVPIQEEIAGNAGSGAGQLCSSQGPAGHGTLVYLSGKSSGERAAVAWLDAAGKKAPLVAPGGEVYTPRLSPGGNKLALSMTGDISTTTRNAAP
jgi:hypothetical protein